MSGLALSLSSGALVADLIASGKRPEYLGMFSPGRFTRGEAA